MTGGRTAEEAEERTDRGYQDRYDTEARRRYVKVKYSILIFSIVCLRFVACKVGLKEVIFHILSKKM